MQNSVKRLLALIMGLVLMVGGAQAAGAASVPPQDAIGEGKYIGWNGYRQQLFLAPYTGKFPDPQNGLPNWEFVYCFNESFVYPPSISNLNDPGSDYFPESAEEARPIFTKKLATGELFYEAANQDEKPPRLEGDQLAKAVLKVIYHGFPHSEKSLKAKFGVDDPYALYMATQQAIWYYTEGNSLDAAKRGLEGDLGDLHEGAQEGAEKVLEYLVSDELADAPENWFLELYSQDRPGKNRSNAVPPKPYQHLLGVNFKDESGNPVPSTSVTTSPTSSTETTSQTSSEETTSGTSTTSSETTSETSTSGTTTGTTTTKSSEPSTSSTSKTARPSTSNTTPVIVVTPKTGNGTTTTTTTTSGATTVTNTDEPKNPGKSVPVDSERREITHVPSGSTRWIKGMPTYI